jgi:DNA modification methylase
VDLIYVDPPFFSNRQYEVLWEDGYELRAFEDRWKGGIENYISWMREKLRECHRVLKTSGSMYLHCDWHANAHLRVLMDTIFGEGNFRNEIIWKRSQTRSSISKIYRRAHDTVLFYSKSQDYFFDLQYKKLSEGSMKMYENKDAKGYYQLVPLLVSGRRKGETGQVWQGIDPNIRGREGMHWVTKPSKLDVYEKKGLVVWLRDGKGTPRLKYYLKDNKGVPMSDIWDDIDVIPSSSNEAQGYPTQKPEALLERVVKASSKRGDIVLDPMCGCGTALAVAHKLERKWVGIDVSPTACKLMVKRMRSLSVQIGDKDIIGLPRTLAEIKAMPPFEFQNWVVGKLMARPAPRKVGDMGIDGYLFDGSPIQVKQSESVGRNVIDNFGAAIRRAKKTKGVIIALSFGRGAYEEVARLKNADGVEIELKTVEDIMREI